MPPIPSLTMTNDELEAFVLRDFVEDDRPAWLWFYWRAPYRQLLALLRETKHAQVRAEICLAFEGRRTPSARPAMLAAMRDRSAQVRAAAVKAVVKLARPEDGPALLAAFPKQSLESQRLLAAALGDLGAREAIPLLTELLNDLFLRDAAAFALRKLDVEFDAPSHMTASELDRFLAERRSGSDWEKRVRSEARIDDIIHVLRTSTDPVVRQTLSFFLLHHPAKRAREALLERLFDDDASVRWTAAEAYQRVAKFGDGPIIMGAYRLERDYRAKYELNGALGAARHRGAIPIFKQHLLADDWSFIQSAGWGLTQIGGQEAVEVFKYVESVTTDPDKLRWLARWRDEVEARMVRTDGG